MALAVPLQRHLDFLNVSLHVFCGVDSEAVLVDVHELAAGLGEDVAAAALPIHLLTGTRMTAAFDGHNNKAGRLLRPRRCHNPW